MDQDATWYGGRPWPGHIVLDGDPAPPPKKKDKGHSLQFLAHVFCGQRARWIKMSLGTKVDVGPGHVLHGDPALLTKGAQPPPIIGPCVVAERWMDQDVTW